jgi:large repetitive protein
VKGNVPVTLEASAGGWQTVDADGVAKGMQVVVTDGVGTFSLIAPKAPVKADVRASSPLASATEQISFTPESRAFTAIGLLQGRIDLRRLSGGSLDLTNAADGFEESLNDLTMTRDSGRVRAGARGALLLKGNVKGAGLLTLAYDTERDRDKTQFRDITPDQGWAVFGDGSLREFDAQSMRAWIAARRSCAMATSPHRVRMSVACCWRTIAA